MRSAATRIALSYYGQPYIWGGEFPYPGLDCSGFVRIVLAGIGKMPLDPDRSSGMIWESLKLFEIPEPKEGCLVFYGRRDRVNHVMYCVNKTVCIGAVGGNSKCRTVRIALDRNAKVDFRPINYRKDIIGYVDLFKK